MRIRDYRGYWQYWEEIKTPTRNYFVTGDGQGAQHSFYLQRGLNGPLLTCHGLSAKVDRTHNTFRVSVPRTCLKRPRWVRMHLPYDVAALNPLNDDHFLDFNPRSGLARRLHAG